MKCSECLSKPDDIRCSEDCRQMLINQTIAARDKWLIAKLNEELTLIRLTAGQDDFTPGYYVAMPEVRWDELKKSILGNER